MNVLLVINDVVAAAAAFFIAYTVRNFGPLRLALDAVNQPFGVYLGALPFAIAGLLILFRLRGLYHPRQRSSAGGETLRVAQTVTLWALLIAAGSYFVKYDYSRLIVTLTWITTISCVSVSRFLLGELTARLKPTSPLHQRVLIIGTGRPAKVIAHQLERYRRHGFFIVGHVALTPNGQAIGTLNELPMLLARHHINRVYFAEPALSYHEILTTINTCPKRDVEFRIAANVFPRLMPVTLLYDVEAIPALDLKKLRPALLHRTVKRNIDMLVGTGLLLASLPLWLMIVPAIMLDSRGPILLRQIRVGKDSRRFTMFKFRTMTADSVSYAPAPASPEDGRITTTGRLLRRWSLDELPQLINVITGDMSLVGPRPEMPFIVEQYEDWQRLRLAVKPGLTGLWQVLGRKDLPLHKHLEYDFYYVNNQSLLLDFIIILKTIPEIIFGRGAY